MAALSRAARSAEVPPRRHAPSLQVRIAAIVPRADRSRSGPRRQRGAGRMRRMPSAKPLELGCHALRAIRCSGRATRSPAWHASAARPPRRRHAGVSAAVPSRRRSPTQHLGERCSGTTERYPPRWHSSCSGMRPWSCATKSQMVRASSFRSRSCRCSSPSSCSAPSSGRPSCGSCLPCSRTRSGRSADASAQEGFATSVCSVRRRAGSNRPRRAGRSRSRTSVTRSPLSPGGSVVCSVVGAPPRHRARTASPRSRASVGSLEAGIPSVDGQPGCAMRGGSHPEPFRRP